MAPTIFLSEAPLQSNPNVARPSAPKDINDLRPGHIVQSAQYWFIWNEYCESYDSRIKWRHRGDPLCDAALNELLERVASAELHGGDILALLESHSEASEHIPTFLHSIHGRPPPDISASSGEIGRAQHFFAAHAVPITMALLYFSLAGGFASPRVSRVLRSTSYLLSAKNGIVDKAAKERTQSRLLETLQFVIEVMGGSWPRTSTSSGVESMNPGTGDAWRACVKVRLLHAMARRRVLRRNHEEGSVHYYDSAIDGIPLNQEDLATTLAAFAYAPLHCLPWLGYRLSLEDAEATIALWRHIGFYMGVDPRILRKHFSSWERAETFSATCAQIFILEITEGERLAKARGVEPPLPPTVPVISAIDTGMGLTASLEFRLAMCRLFLGEDLSRVLNLPPTRPVVGMRLRLALFTMAIPTWFGYFYAAVLPVRGGYWERRRAELMLEGLARMAWFKMGKRRTAYRPRDEKGDMAHDVAEQEIVEADPGTRNAFLTAWKWLWMEMVTVMALISLLLIYSVWAMTTGLI